MGRVLVAPGLEVATAVVWLAEVDAAALSGVISGIFPFPFPFAFVVLAAFLFLFTVALTNAGAGCSEASMAEPVGVGSPSVTFATRNNVAVCNHRPLWFVTVAAVSCLRRSGERTDRMRR